MAARFLCTFLNDSGGCHVMRVIANQWCSAQRIRIVMIASGNHTVIYCRLVWQSVLKIRNADVSYLSWIPQRIQSIFLVSVITASG